LAKFTSKKILKGYFYFIRDFFKDLFEDRIGYYASSLSWNTLFAIIPLLAISLYLFTTMPIFDSVHQKVQNLIFANLMPAQSNEIMRHINTFVQNSYKLGIVGIFYVMFASFMFFKNYDYIVNDIFELSPRKLHKAIRIYTFLMIFVPLMIGVSFYVSNIIQTLLDKSEITSVIHLYAMVPYLIVWLVFYIAYQLSAHTHIDFMAALSSSFISSMIWYVSKSAFVFYVVHNKTYASVYGGISTVLFFFLWIYISWAIFLHGLRLCYLIDKNDDIDKIV
jgi:membrane protein